MVGVKKESSLEEQLYIMASARITNHACPEREMGLNKPLHRGSFI